MLSGRWVRNLSAGLFCSTTLLIYMGSGCSGSAPVGGSPSGSPGGGQTVTPANGLDYDIVYVRQPRFGDDTNTLWPEVFHPARLDPGADLMLLHPDGSEEVLVTAGHGSVTDPFVSFDGTAVYYSYFPDLRAESLNGQRGDLPLSGSDIYRIDLATRVITRLTFGEFTPNTGAGRWDDSNPVNPASEYNRLGYGILNLGPCPLPGGRIIFTSNRNGYTPPKSFTNPTLQLFVMDADGANVTPIAPMSINSVLHPTIMRDGRVMFSSYESQGLRDRRVWGIWTIYPDGRQWAPLVSAFHGPHAFHFMTQLSDGDIVVEDYYNLNNNGFGAFYRFPVQAPAGQPSFFSAFLADNPALEVTRGNMTDLGTFKMPYTPYGMYAITPFTHPFDQAAPLRADGGERVGKVTHPSGAPGGDMLLVWTPGPANDLNRPEQTPRYDAGIYRMVGGGPVYDPDDLVLLKNDPAYNEAWPRPVVPYRSVHGVDEPAALAWLPNDGTVHDQLPAGTPYGLIGTSSFYKRESFPGQVTSWNNTFDGLDAFNTSENGQSSNWSTQGSDAGRYDDSDIWAVRIVALEPNTHRSYGPNHGQHFVNHANERHRILGEIPLRKRNADGTALLDAEGNPDTSFMARIPADTPFTFQTLDRNGMILNMAQTWHQVRPGEMRVDCGGCHAHSQMPLPFEGTAAARPDYVMADLIEGTTLITHDAAGQPALSTHPQSMVDVEFYRDVRPILQDHCVSCHTQADSSPPGRLVLDDTAMVGNVPGDYKRLADDTAAEWGIPPLIPNGSWRQTNASRYIRRFQSRRSLLMWKVFGARLDGWTNADHPSAAVPGDPSTLPEGATPNESDLDFIGTIMPPPNSGAAPLTIEQKMTLARWIDLGCPIDTGHGTDSAAFGWFLDDLRPTLTISAPRPGRNTGPLTVIRIGVADANSGIRGGSLSIQADFVVAGRQAGAELADLFSETAPGIFTMTLDSALRQLHEAHLTAEVTDNQGNITRVDRKFSID